MKLLQQTTPQTCNFLVKEVAGPRQMVEYMKETIAPLGLEDKGSSSRKREHVVEIGMANVIKMISSSTDVPSKNMIRYF